MGFEVLQRSEGLSTRRSSFCSLSWIEKLVSEMRPMLGGINVLERIDSSSRGGDLRLEAVNLLVQGMSPALHVESPWLLNMKRKSQACLVVVVECERGAACV